MLPHPGGGGETYIDMLERMRGVAHERCYLSGNRSSAAAITSLPLRWATLARRLGAFELVHVHGDAAAVIMLPLLARRPSLITTHGLHLWRRSSGWRRALVASLLRASIRRSRAVICTSAGERNELTRLVGPEQPDKLRIVHNGVDLREPVSGEERESSRMQLGVDPGTVLGLFAGQLESRKAPLLAVAAARRLHERGVPFVLALAGDGPDAPALRALAGPAVRPLGYRADLPGLMGACDVFVQPSEREGLSFALLEAMASGLAIVAADGPGNPEAVGEAGVLFPAGDEESLVDALARLCADAQLRADLGQAARQRASTEFAAERFVVESQALYREITDSTASAKAIAGAG